MNARLIHDEQLWDTFVLRNAPGEPCQMYAWGSLSHYWDAQALHVGIFDDQERLVGAALTLVEQVPRLKQTYFYIPRGPVCASPDPAIIHTLLTYLRQQAKAHTAFMLRIAPNAVEPAAAWEHVLPKAGFHAVPCTMQARHEWVLDITPDADRLLAQMKPKWRYNIRLAQKRGVRIRHGRQQDIETFYRLFQETSARDGFFIHPQAFYEDFFALFSKREQAVLLLAEYQGTAVAAGIILRLGTHSYYMYGASSGNAEHRRVMPNHLLQWEAIQWAQVQGCSRYNFGGIALTGTTSLAGVYQFKRGFGGAVISKLATHDYIFLPVRYRLYSSLVALKNGYCQLKALTSLFFRTSGEERWFFGLFSRRIPMKEPKKVFEWGKLIRRNE